MGFFFVLNYPLKGGEVVSIFMWAGRRLKGKGDSFAQNWGFGTACSGGAYCRFLISLKITPVNLRLHFLGGLKVTIPGSEVLFALLYKCRS